MTDHPTSPITQAINAVRIQHGSAGMLAISMFLTALPSDAVLTWENEDGGQPWASCGILAMEILDGEVRTQEVVRIFASPAESVQIPMPYAGQMWRSPSARVAKRVVAHVTPRSVHYARRGCSVRVSHAAWAAWARRTGARP